MVPKISYIPHIEMLMDDTSKSFAEVSKKLYVEGNIHAISERGISEYASKQLEQLVREALNIKPESLSERLRHIGDTELESLHEPQNAEALAKAKKEVIEFWSSLESGVSRFFTSEDYGDALDEFRKQFDCFFRYRGDGLRVPINAEDRIYAALLNNYTGDSIFGSRNSPVYSRNVSDSEGQCYFPMLTSDYGDDLPNLNDLIRLVFRKRSDSAFQATLEKFKSFWPGVEFFPDLRQHSDFMRGLEDVLNHYVYDMCASVHNLDVIPKNRTLLPSPRPTLFLLKDGQNLMREFTSFPERHLDGDTNYRRQCSRMFVWLWNNTLERRQEIPEIMGVIYDRIESLRCSSEKISDWFAEFCSYLRRQETSSDSQEKSFDCLAVCTESTNPYDNITDNVRNTTCVLGPRGFHKKVAIFYEVDPYVGSLRLIPSEERFGNLAWKDAFGFAPVFQVYNDDDELCWLVDSVDVGIGATLFGDIWMDVYFDGILKAAMSPTVDPEQKPSKLYFNQHVTNYNSRMFNMFIKRATAQDSKKVFLRKRGGNQSLRDARIPRPQHFVEAFHYDSRSMWIKDDRVDGSFVPKRYKSKVIEIDLRNPPEAIEPHPSPRLVHSLPTYSIRK
jgi:hypothetical protein